MLLVSAASDLFLLHRIMSFMMTLTAVFLGPYEMGWLGGDLLCLRVKT